MERRDEKTDNRRHRKLADNATINAFAYKWRAKVFERSRDIEKITFADECDALGFHMDCGESFNKAFPKIDFCDVDCFERVVVKNAKTRPEKSSARCFVKESSKTAKLI